jgi:hypothetical protein
MRWFNGGPGYTMNDLVYYSGLFFGIIAVYAIARPYGFHSLIVLVVGICVGAGLGYTLERVYKNSRRDA